MLTTEDIVNYANIQNLSDIETQNMILDNLIMRMNETMSFFISNKYTDTAKRVHSAISNLTESDFESYSFLANQGLEAVDELTCQYDINISNIPSDTFKMIIDIELFIRDMHDELSFHKCNHIISEEIE